MERSSNIMVNDVTKVAQLALVAYESSAIERIDIIDIINTDTMFEVKNNIPEVFRQTLVDMASMVPLFEDTLNIGFLTDNHYEDTPYAFSSLGHYKYIAEMSKLVHLDAIIAGGDNVNGNTTKAHGMKHNGDVASLLLTRSNCDVFLLKGNHEDCSYYSSQSGKNTLDEVITDEELQKLYHTTTCLYGEKRKGSSLYFYKDYEKHKVRVIGLNSFDLPYVADSNGKNKYPTIDISGFQNEQLNWLGNTALKLPSNEWQVIIFSHAPINGSFATFRQINGDLLLGILKAFKTGTTFQKLGGETDVVANVNVDFTSQGPGTIIAFVSGHLHRDSQMNFEGINCIQSLNSLCDNSHPGETPYREEGNSNEDAWDIFSIDTSTRKIKILRFGAGDGRIYGY
ncbi:metallophosphoesterase family protein [Bacillus wiedmannii]|uniref:metallophosphoesterase family protein n=1 Tax=Bacillus wiedmannii TaxID=1890302 RepID=UPI003F92898B